MKSSSETIDRIREAVDIVQLVGEVVSLKKKGANHFGICPFHQEKSASFSVNENKQLFHCFGCKAGGDIFKFVELYYRWDFPQALEELARRAGVSLGAHQSNQEWEQALAILEEATCFFEQQLSSQNGSRFHQYLEQRKIPSALWSEFRLGAHSGEAHSLSEHLKHKGFSRDIAVRLGLLGRSSSGEYWDRFRGRLIFPIADARGRTRGFGGRSLGSEEPKYLNSPKSFVFDKSHLLYGMHLASSDIRRRGYIVLVEGYFDVIALREYGLPQTVGTMGTALTREQVRLMRRWSDKVLSLYDADQAGLTATERNLAHFFEEGIEAKIALFPHSKDPDAYLHSEQGDREEKRKGLRDLLEGARSAVDFFVENKVLAAKSVEGRGKQLRELVQLLERIKDPLQRAYFKKDLARRFDLPVELLEGDAKASSKSEIRAESSLKATKQAHWELELLKVLVYWGEEEDFPLTELIPHLNFSSKWAKLLRELIEEKRDSRSIAKLDWLERLEEEDQVQIREWIVEGRPHLSQEQIWKWWEDVVNRMKSYWLKMESKRLQDAIQAAEERQDIESVRKLLTEKQDLIRLYRAEQAGLAR